ncbi:Chromosomal replication initiator protein DnaA [Rosistilla carotiformis]|uniref:Chromosomal replication initiator protein DnaA n=1 Tax=Rosistilla carotiformis TaxID=2528017 RepID=A0A518JX89_9BACT|nr:DnaA/Hda family protein [Rosistilla carotiformis]QDV70154.1 Chromosomal replication initiator protein DnaA [Rosistilla carotiformis]
MSVTETAGAKDLTGELQDALINRLGRDCFRMWFGQITHCHRAGRDVVVDVAAQFALDRIGSRYMNDLRQAVVDVCGDGVSVSLQLAADKPAEASAEPTEEPASTLRSDAGDATPPRPAAKTAKRQAAAETPRDNVQPLLQVSSFQSTGSDDPLPARRRRAASWDQIVVGKSNKLAATAARMICDSPGVTSPLFLWGTHGTGKTQLLDVVATELRRRHRLRRVISMTAEEFTNDFIGSVTGSGLPGFRRRYRDVDALLIDEIQFLPGKRATSREMLYTIDSIVRAGKQLVFAADRPPMEIPGLGQDLAGRMAGGMVCSMTPLDHEMRSQMLQQLCDAEGLGIDHQMLSDIAANVCGDGRVVSGIACRLKALVSMHDEPVTYDQITEILSDLISIGSSSYGFSDIQTAVCNTMGLPKDALQSKGQSRNVSQARMLAMYLAREHTGATYGDIGKYFGQRSHSAVIAATRRIAGDVETGKAFAVGNRTIPAKQVLESVQNMLRSG